MKQHNLDLATAALRLSLASVFLFHGAQKLFGLFGGYGIDGTAGYMESIGLPFGTLMAVLAGATELLGGLALLLGVGVRLASVPLAFTMLIAAFLGHPGSFDAAKGGMEYPLTLLAGIIALGLLGPGSYSIASMFRPAPALETV